MQKSYRLMPIFTRLFNYVYFTRALRFVFSRSRVEISNKYRSQSNKPSDRTTIRGLVLRSRAQ